MKDHIIRKAEPEDIEGIFGLMEEFSLHLGGPFELDLSKEDFAAAVFDEKAQFGIFVVEANGKLVGYCSHIYQFSIWTAKHYIYIDDFFIQPDYRSKGIGEEIMNLTKIEAKIRGIDTIKWEVQIENQRGRDFYEKLGGEYREAGLFKWKV